MRFSLHALVQTNTCMNSSRCHIYTGAVEGATSTFHVLYQSDRSHPKDTREMQNDPVLSVHLCYCEHNIKTNIAVDPLFLSLSLISPSRNCCFEPNRHTELIVGSKSWLIMAVNHQRFWRWVRHRGNCCQTFVCVTGASRLSEPAWSALSPVQSFMSEAAVTNEGLVNLYTPVKQQNLCSVMSWCMCHECSSFCVRWFNQINLFSFE